MQNFPRSGGILLHPSSLPGPYGIGDLGPQAFRFLDWLSDSGCKLWQVLPLGPTGYGDSPYQCFSAFAGNPYLISPDFLARDGLLTDSDFQDKPAFSTSHVNFGEIIPWKLSLLERSFEKFQETASQEVREEFSEFRALNSGWLEDFALFMALKESQGGGSWTDWPVTIRKRNENALGSARQSLAQSILKFAFYQFLFFRQWEALRDYGHKKGIRIIGDIPIFVAGDSSDVWSHPELFCLDDDRRPVVVAGVPPDYFSPTGQLWGNPLYRWEVHKNTGYAWWLERFRAILRAVDYIRLDHFRGFAGYWEIPAGNPTAEIGRWVQGPGADMFDVISKGLAVPGGGGNLPIIAEDLGVITSDVVELRDRYNLPGMKIVQFGFSSPDNPFLPHAYIQNCVAYTGTHDNDTARGWLDNAPKLERSLAFRYLRSTKRNFVWSLIRSIWSSTATFAIIPMQDVLELGSEARMNYPSRLGGNWDWRMEESDMETDPKEKLKELNYLYNR
jgi:4-alpha-glucanotransferase